MATIGNSNSDFQLFKRAVLLVLHDKGFDLPTERAQRARLAAEKLVGFMERDKEAVEIFAVNLLRQIYECCTHPRAVSCHIFKERLWEKFYKLSSSSVFVDSWIKFLTGSIGMTGGSIFYQFVSQSLLETIIKLQFPLELSLTTDEGSSLDFEERNALRYVGGYLLRSLMGKVMKSSNPLKEELLLCLKDLFECYNASPDEVAPESLSWTNEVNRGSLIIIDDSMYSFLLSVEVEFRRHFTLTNATTVTTEAMNLKDVAFNKIIVNEDVLFTWALISVNWESRDADELLKLIIKHYITLRGFSFTSAFMEKYKQSTKTSTQKSKALRKTLVSSAGICHNE